MAKTETQILWERNQLILFLTKLYPCWLEPISQRGDFTTPYRCVILTPCGIMSWEVGAAHLRYFDCVERRNEQSGQLLTQTPSEQYALLREMPQQWVPDLPEVDIDINQMKLL